MIVGTNRYTFSLYGLLQWFIILHFKPNIQCFKSILNKTWKNAKETDTKLLMSPEAGCVTTVRFASLKRVFFIIIGAQLPILPIVYDRYYFFDSSEKKFDAGIG